MGTYTLRHFAQPDILKSLNPTRLITLLKPYADYFKQRGFCFPTTDISPTIEYDTLSAILLQPTDTIDVNLIDALFFIQETAHHQCTIALLESAKAHGVRINETDSPADIALALWLKQPALLKRAHAQRALSKPKAFVYFRSRYHPPPSLPHVTSHTIARMQSAMDTWFLQHQRGTGCRIVPVNDETEQKLYFLIRHGMPFKREGTLNAGQSATIFYRPEFHDVIVYDVKYNELAIYNKSRANKERQLYLDLFGHYLFQDIHYFSNVATNKYTLEPLRREGTQSLVCSDILGLHSVHLIEVELCLGAPPYQEKRVHRTHNTAGSDLFTIWQQQGTSFPDGQLCSARLRVHFAEHQHNPRIVKITLPNLANFDRKEDAPTIEKFLHRRGFILTTPLAQDNTIDDFELLALG